jgi:hypothetical protein
LCKLGYSKRIWDEIYPFRGFEPGLNYRRPMSYPSGHGDMFQLEIIIEFILVFLV